MTLGPGPTDVGGLRVAHPVRIGYDLAARRPLERGTAYLDAAVRAGIVDLEEMREWLLRCHDNDVVGVRAALAECDPRAESIPESELRVILRRAGFPVVVQHVIKDGARRIMRADLALPELRIAILYDGAWHALRDVLENDRAQQRALQQAGWLAVHVTANLLRDVTALIAAVAAVVDRRR
jgi:very-short-patch-repair endonuclease